MGLFGLNWSEDADSSSLPAWSARATWAAATSAADAPTIDASSCSSFCASACSEASAFLAFGFLLAACFSAAWAARQGLIGQVLVLVAGDQHPVGADGRGGVVRRVDQRSPAAGLRARGARPLRVQINDSRPDRVLHARELGRLGGGLLEGGLGLRRRLGGRRVAWPAAGGVPVELGLGGRDGGRQRRGVHPDRAEGDGVRQEGLRALAVGVGGGNLGQRRQRRGRPECQAPARPAPRSAAGEATADWTRMDTRRPTPAARLRARITAGVAARFPIDEESAIQIGRLSAASRPVLIQPVGQSGYFDRPAHSGRTDQASRTEATSFESESLASPKRRTVRRS